MDLANQLKISREAASLSQNDVASELNISRQAISQWENGRSYPDIDNLIILSELYHFNFDELIDENTDLKERLAIYNAEHNIVKPKDEGIMLLFMAFVSFLIAPLGLALAPIIILRNKKTNTFYRVINVVSVCAIIYNIYFSVMLVHTYHNWGAADYH